MHNDVIIPALYCPFLPVQSEHLPEVRQHTDEWVREFDLYPGLEYSRYRNDNFAAMTCRFYAGSVERLCAANDLLTLLFALDDLADHGDKGVSPDFLMEFLQILSTGRYEGKILFFCALADVWQRIKGLSPSAVQRKLGRDIRLLFNGISWERRNGDQHRTPTLEEYFTMRPAAGGAALAGSLIEMVGNFQLPSFLDASPDILLLNNLCGRLGCTANDLFSLKKELNHQDTHNLVVVLQTSYGYPVQAAVNHAVTLHNQFMDLFARIIEGLPVYKEKTRRVVAHYVEGLIGIVRGNIDWSLKDSSRYGYSTGDEVIVYSDLATNDTFKKISINEM